MIEVFKTNVQDKDQSTMLIAHIQQTFAGYSANFDLDDCDRIMRIKSVDSAIDSNRLIELLKLYGCEAVVLAG